MKPHLYNHTKQKMELEQCLYEHTREQDLIELHVAHMKDVGVLDNDVVHVDGVEFGVVSWERD